jgi:hypothetical protein
VFLSVNPGENWHRRKATGGAMKGKDRMDRIMRDIRKDMKVYDRNHNEIGVVEFVKFGDEDPATLGFETTGVNPMDRDDKESFIDSLLDVFTHDDLPQALRDRLLRFGFVRIDGEGLFSADRYILPDQIQSVADGKVMLKVKKSELIKQS